MEEDKAKSESLKCKSEPSGEDKADIPAKKTIKAASPWAFWCFGLAIFVICEYLIIFAVGENVPILLDIREKIVALASKCWLILPAALPLAFSCIGVIFKRSKIATALSRVGFIITFYQVVLIFVCIMTSDKLSVGDTFEVPLGTLVFLPLALSVTAMSFKIKSTKYKSKLGFNFKVAHKTEFIWKQTHMFASYAFGALGLILIILSIVFSFIRIFLVPLSAFILGIIVTTLIVYLNSRQMYKKYMEMERRRTALSDKNPEQ